MSTVVLNPPSLTPEELDEYLASGWYRIGSTLMTCRYYIHEDEVYSTIWTRLPLESLRLSRSNRKLLSKLGRRYRTTTAPARIDAQRASLYERYLTVAPGERSRTLEDFLGGNEARPLFETWETGIWDGDRLVAFSLFDLGQHSAQSLIGAYDPEYGKDSLGYATMLLEILAARDRDRRYHYSGYVVPGVPFMDYKWRVGELEFLDPETRVWRPRTAFPELKDPAEQLRLRLQNVQEYLQDEGMPSRLVVNEMFEGRHIDPALSACLDDPLLLECTPAGRESNPLVVVWDHIDRSFHLLQCVRVAGRLVPVSDPDARGRDVTYWLLAKRMLTERSPSKLAHQIATLVRGDR